MDRRQRPTSATRLRLAVIGTVAMIAGLMAPTAAAHAAPPSAKIVDTKTTVQATETATQVTTVLTVEATKPAATKQGTARASGVVIYTCTMQENYPHKSGHVSGQINVVGTATCQVPMTSINLVQNLHYNGRSWAYKYNYATPGGTYQAVQANATCAAGNWQGIMNYWLTWPSGSNPPASSGTVASPVIPITC